MKKIFNKFFRSEILKNIAILASGAIIGSGINFISIPIISRVYAPSEIGEYDLIISMAKTVSDAIGLGLLIAIMLPAEDKKARTICTIMLKSNFIFVALIGTSLLLLSPYFKIYHITFNYRFSLILLCCYLLSFNIQNIYYSFVNREKIFGILFKSTIFQAFTNSGITIILGICGLGTCGYMLGTISSYCICIYYMSHFVHPFRKAMTLNEAKTVLREFRAIPFVQLPANFISNVSSAIPTQFWGRVFGTDVLGGYSMANKLLSVPVALLATPINRVIYKEIVEKKNQDQNVGDFCFKIIEKNIKIAILPISLLIIFGKYIIPIFLGEQWESSGFYITILGFVYLFSFCSTCLSGTLVAMGKELVCFYLSVFSIIKYLICFTIIYYFRLSIEAGMILFALTESVYHIINLYLCVLYTNYSRIKFFSFIFKYIVGSAVLIYGIYYAIFSH